MRKERDSSVEKKNTFARILHRTDVLVLAFGAMIGWGWVVQAGNWIESAGSLGAALAFIIGGVIIYFVGLVYAELTSAMPECGGEHVFSKEAFGYNVSFICSWSLVLGYLSVVLFEVVSLPTVLEYLFPNFSQIPLYTVAGYEVRLTWMLVGVLGALLITLINYLGIRFAAKLQTMLVMVMAAVGIALLSGSAAAGDRTNLEPLISNGTGGVLNVLVLVPFFYMGFDVIPQAAEEINVPFKKIGSIILLSIVLAVLWHVIVIFSVSYVMADSELRSASLVTANAMKLAFGNSDLAAKILIIGGISGIVTSWNAFFVGGSRAIYAMAESEMLPRAFARISPKYKSPVTAILFIGAISCAAPFFGRQALLWISNAGSISVCASYFIVSLSFLKLRRSRPDMERPYRVKHGKLVGILASVLSGCVLLLFVVPVFPSCLSATEWLIIGVWTLAGLFLYLHSRYRKHGAEGRKYGDQ